MIRKKRLLVYYKKKKKNMEQLSVSDWNNVSSEDIEIILEAALTGDDSKLLFKHYLIVRFHKEKLEELL